MRLRRCFKIACLEEFLTKNECWDLIKKNKMDSLSTLCKQSRISHSTFVLPNSLSLNDIYATKKDWDFFTSTMNDSLTDPSANAISHYLNPKNNRIITNSVFFTDSTSGVSLLNPRFVYLVKKSNDKFSKDFPDIHKEIKVVSVPVDAAEIENYYTEQSIDVNFYLSVSYSESPDVKKIKISPDVNTFIKSLKGALSGRDKVDLSQGLDDQKKQAILDSIEFYSNQIDVLQKFQHQINPHIDQIDDILVGRKILNKNVLAKIMDIIPESLHDTIYFILKDGVLKDGKIKISLSNKPIIGKSLHELLQNKESSLYKLRAEYEDQLDNSKGSTEQGSNNKDKLNDYIDALMDRLTDIYRFVTENPLNSKGTIPKNILTDFRNRNAKIFVLSPNSNNSHRCMYIAPIGNDLRDLKFGFNAAGTDSSDYSVQNGSLVVT